MGRKVCLKCGRNFFGSSNDNRKSVLSCSRCTVRFSDEDLDGFISSMVGRGLL